jgi:hypothetical protein
MRRSKPNVNDRARPSARVGYNYAELFAIVVYGSTVSVNRRVTPYVTFTPRRVALLDRGQLTETPAIGTTKQSKAGHAFT